MQEPLNTIVNYSNLLQSNFSDKLDSLGQKSLFYLNQGALRMSKLVKALLDYLQIGDNGKLILINTNNEINEVLNELEDLIKTTNAEIIVTELPNFYGYQKEIKLLFKNLISNALKFKEPTRNLIIEINAFEKKGHIEFTVKDNGIGIPEDKFEDIFKVFKRLYRENQIKGIGIGLALCEKVIKLHKGKIWVNSTLDSGSIFTFTVRNHTKN